MQILFLLSSIATLQRNDSNPGNTPRRPIYKSAWTRQTSVDINNPVYTSGEQQYQRQNSGFSFFKSLNRSLSRKSDSFDYPNQSSLPQEQSPYNQPVPVQVPPSAQQPNSYSTDRQISFQGLPNEQAGTYPGKYSKLFLFGY